MFWESGGNFGVRFEQNPHIVVVSGSEISHSRGGALLLEFFAFPSALHTCLGRWS